MFDIKKRHSLVRNIGKISHTIHFHRCCPMITPDGPGCPIMISGQFCPLGNTDACALKGMSSPPRFPPSTQPEKDEESCPIGELLAQRSAKGFPNGGSPNQKSSCNCAAATSTQQKQKRPEGCPLAAMDVRPPAPPCPLTSQQSQKQCPMTIAGGTNFDESCPVSNLFECPGLKKAALAKLFNRTSPSKLPLKSVKKVPSKEKNVNTSLTQANSNSTPNEGRNGHTKRSIKSRNSAHQKVLSNPALQQAPSAVPGKTENVMGKTVSAVYDSLATSKSTRTKLKSSESSFFEVSLEPLPRPPLSENENTRNRFRC